MSVSVCLSVCLSVRDHTFGTARLLFTKFTVHVTHGFTFLCDPLTQVVLEKRPLNGCSDGGGGRYPVGVFGDVLGEFGELPGRRGISIGSLQTVQGLARHLFRAVDHSLDLGNLGQRLVRLQLALSHLLIEL